jgi:hypothetical protein
MAKEREDYSGPIENTINYEDFSKEFLLKLMRIWQVHWDEFVTNFVMVGSLMEGIGQEKTLELQFKVFEAVLPSTMAKIAELAKCDIDTQVGRCKASMLAIDNIEERYDCHWEVKSDNEVLLVIDRCRVVDTMRALGDLGTLRKICLEKDPEYGEMLHAFPGHSQKTKVTMLKVPETLDPPPEGEPVCIWRWALEE